MVTPQATTTPSWKRADRRDDAVSSTRGNPGARFAAPDYHRSRKREAWNKNAFAIAKTTVPTANKTTEMVAVGPH